jgi:hypothetical protein
MALKPEQKKLALIGLLVAILGGSVYYNFFAGDDAPTPTPSRVQVKPLATPKAGAAGSQSAETQATVTLVNQPLPVDSMDSRVAPNVGRNIFIFPTPTPTPTPTPVKTPPPPPPPPITLVGLDPATVEARTPADFTLTVAGAKIPADARAYINGREFKPVQASDSAMRVSVPAALKAAPGALRVEVRSASDAKLYSNVLNLNVINPATPAYRYLGLIVKNGVSTAILKPETDEEVINVKKGERIGNNWQIINITPDEIEILDTRNQVRHRLPFTAPGGNG